MVLKVLVSLPEEDLLQIDAAARAAGESRSAFVRRAALAEAGRGPVRPLDDPRLRRAFAQFLKRAQSRRPLATVRALAARDRGRR